MSKILPKNVEKILNNEYVPDEIILFENDFFILLVDPKNKKDSFHYTAWCKKDIPSLKHLDLKLFQEILILKNKLLEENIINKDSIIFIHYPPQFYRLHIHFVSKKHRFYEPKNHIFYLYDILPKL